MDIYKRIEIITLDLMLKHSKELIYEKNSPGLACLPLNIIFSVDKELETGVFEEIPFSDEAFEKSICFFDEILEGSLFSNIAKGASFGLNPVRALAKNMLELESNEYRVIRSTLRLHGLDIVLGAFSEMMNRGATPEKILNLLEDFHPEEGEELEDSILYLVDTGVIDGSIDSVTAKTGRVVGGGTGAIAGAALGSMIFPVVGTAIGAAIGSEAGKMFGEQASRPEDESDIVAEKAKQFASKVKSFF